MKASDTPKAVKTIELRESRRDKIVSAALRQFSSRDYADVSTREIAADAGVSLRLMWHHFRTKEEIRANVDDLVIAAMESIPVADHRESAAIQFEYVMKGVADLVDRLGTEIIHYWRRMLLDEGERGQRAFRVLMNRCRQIDGFAEVSEMQPEDRHREIALMSVIAGPLLLKSHIDSFYGVDIHTRQEYGDRSSAVSKAVTVLARRPKGRV